VPLVKPFARKGYMSLSGVRQRGAAPLSEQAPKHTFNPTEAVRYRWMSQKSLKMRLTQGGGNDTFSTTNH
jgi:hypothetical protein